MRAGKLRKRVQVQALQNTVDNFGSLVEAWATAFSRWADVRPISGKEPYTNEQHLAELNTVVELRYDSQSATITPKHRIKYGERILEIESVVNIGERNKELILLCYEYV